LSQICKRLNQACQESSSTIFWEICWNKMLFLEHKFLRSARHNWCKRLHLMLFQTPWDLSFLILSSHLYLSKFLKRVTLKCSRWCWMAYLRMVISRIKLLSILLLIQCLDAAEMNNTTQRSFSGSMRDVSTIPKTKRLRVLSFQFSRSTRLSNVSTAQTLSQLKKRMNWCQRWKSRTKVIGWLKQRYIASQQCLKTKRKCGSSSGPMMKTSKSGISGSSSCLIKLTTKFNKENTLRNLKTNGSITSSQYRTSSEEV